MVVIGRRPQSFHKGTEKVRGLPFELLNLFGQHWDSFKQIADDTVVRNVKNGCFRMG